MGFSRNGVIYGVLWWQDDVCFCEVEWVALWFGGRLETEALCELWLDALGLFRGQVWESGGRLDVVAASREEPHRAVIMPHDNEYHV